MRSTLHSILLAIVMSFLLIQAADPPYQGSHLQEEGKHLLLRYARPEILVGSNHDYINKMLQSDGRSEYARLLENDNIKPLLQLYKQSSDSVDNSTKIQPEESKTDITEELIQKIQEELQFVEQVPSPVLQNEERKHVPLENKEQQNIAFTPLESQQIAELSQLIKTQQLLHQQILSLPDKEKRKYENVPDDGRASYISEQKMGVSSENDLPRNLPTVDVHKVQELNIKEAIKSLPHLPVTQQMNSAPQLNVKEGNIGSSNEESLNQIRRNDFGASASGLLEQSDSESQFKPSLLLSVDNGKEIKHTSPLPTATTETTVKDMIVKSADRLGDSFDNSYVSSDPIPEVTLSDVRRFKPSEKEDFESRFSFEPSTASSDVYPSSTVPYYGGYDLNAYAVYPEPSSRVRFETSAYDDSRLAYHRFRTYPKQAYRGTRKIPTRDRGNRDLYSDVYPPSSRDPYYESPWKSPWRSRGPRVIFPSDLVTFRDQNQQEPDFLAGDGNLQDLQQDTDSRDRGK